jgi:hypothetical protein
MKNFWEKIYSGDNRFCKVLAHIDATIIMVVYMVKYKFDVDALLMELNRQQKDLEYKLRKIKEKQIAIDQTKLEMQQKLNIIEIYRKERNEKECS